MRSQLPNPMHSANPISTKTHECAFGNAVRHGRCGSDPRLVPEFIRSRTIASAEQSRSQQWQTQKAIVELLFDTITYSLEKALAYFVESTAGDWNAAASKMAELVELVHLASENNHAAETKANLDEYLKLADAFSMTL